ncbi:MAG: hypothetical protein OHK0054_05220 [Sideroxydans sp.]
MEAAILADPLFEQVMVVGEGKPYLGLLAVVKRELNETWPHNLHSTQARSYALQRATQRAQSFPGYARIRRIALLPEAWHIENGLLPPPSR